MRLYLKIDNETHLPDGGPLSYELNGTRGADIGRDAHLDWTLPDPSRQISGKHCEIRYKDGGYWLYDVSRNGTFLDGVEGRIQSPHRLRSGERLLIGHYIVEVDVRGESPLAAQPQQGSMPSGFGGDDDPWMATDESPPPIDKHELRPPSESVPVRPDWLEWAVEVPGSAEHAFVLRPAETQPVRDALREPDWDSGPPLLDAALPAPPPLVPTPRRSIWVSQPPDGPWESVERPKTTAPARESIPTPSALDRSAAPEPMPCGSSVVDRFAAGAGVAAERLAAADSSVFAEKLGRLMLLVTDNVKQLLAARQQTKAIARSSNPTMIAALDNNPLKFSPSAADALAIMLGPPVKSYLDAEAALQQSFDDIKSHQIKTFAAMQQALQMLVDDLEPSAIESGVGKAGGMSSWFGQRRARMWQMYEARWQAKTRKGGGMHDAFMEYFAECYDRLPDPAANRRRADQAGR